MGTSATVTLAADFETTTDPNDCRVWAWGCVNIETPLPEHVQVGTTIESFIDYISGFNSQCYFHNLKFDGTFLISWLLTNRFTHSTRRDLLKREFSTLISDMGTFYSVRVRWGQYTTEFRDSFKKFNLSVEQLAHAYQLTTLKTSIDYEKPRPAGYEPTAEETTYIRHDVSIVAQALNIAYSTGAKALTIGSDSLKEFKRVVKTFQQFFPIFNIDMDTEIRRAYRGGFTYADPRFTGRIVGKGMALDVNSLYPSMMLYRQLPYGEPVYVDGHPTVTVSRPLSVFTVTFTARVKPDHVPCIQIKGNLRFAEVEYLRVIDEPVTLTVTNIDWELYNDHYIIDVHAYHGGWLFKATTGIFDDYVHKWREVKENSSGGMREMSKLYLNSLYGKFATNPLVKSKYPVLDEHGVVKLKFGLEERREPVYTAVGVFITSWARDLTIRAAQANYGVFAYADTDSLHLLTDTVPDTLDMDQDRFGAWAHEYDYQAAYYIRAKAYLEQKLDGTYVNRIAGLPRHISEKLTFDDVRDGLMIDGKLVPRNVPGGVVLTETSYTLKL